MHVFCDESGNTGVDLINPDQPVFALASTCINTEVASALIAPLLRNGQKEVKYSKLKGTYRGQQDLIRFFSSLVLEHTSCKVMLVDKKYYLISHLVDKLIEPTLHEVGIDLYASDAHVGLTNVWYYAGHTIFPFGHWGKVLQAFLRAIRQRDNSAFTNFDLVLTRAASVTPPDSRDFATGLLLARKRLGEFIGIYTDLEVFDPAVDMFVSLANQWMSEKEGMIRITHDRSKPLKRNESFLRTLMTPATSRVIGYGNRKAELPLRISEFDFGDSKSIPQLQVSDIIAGAAIDYLLVWSGRKPTSDYHASLQQTKLTELFADGMLPSPTIEKDVAPLPGEKSLVKGTADFLRDVGYWGSSSGKPSRN